MGRKPRVIIDGRKLGDGGIGLYIENLIDGFLLLRGEGEADFDLSLLCSGEGKSRRELLKRLALERWVDEVDFVVDRVPAYSLRDLVAVAGVRRALVARASLYHAPHYILPLFLRIPSVVTVHDVIHVTHPESVLHHAFGSILIRSALKRAAQVITVSEHSRREIEAVFPDLRPNIVVIPNGLREGFVRPPESTIRLTLDARQISPPYAVYIGSDRPHKAFPELLSAFSLAAPEKLKLLCLGDDFRVESRERVRALNLAQRVEFVEALSRDELRAVIAGAKLLLIASREEGFCFPALEAMALGTPVISTPLPSVVEICGASAWYAPGFGAEAIAQALRRFFGQTDRVAARVRSGLERSKRFALRLHARSTLSVYDAVLTRYQSAGNEERFLSRQRRVERGVLTGGGEC